MTIAARRAGISWLYFLLFLYRDSGLAVSFGLYVIFQFRVIERQVRAYRCSPSLASRDWTSMTDFYVLLLGRLLAVADGFAEVWKFAGVHLFHHHRVAAGRVTVGARCRSSTPRRSIRAAGCILCVLQQ